MEKFPNNYFEIGNIYELYYNNYDKMEEYYKLGDSKAYNKLGSYYEYISNYNLMKKFYKMAIDLGNSDAMSSLGYYYQINNNIELMKEYYNMAIELGSTRPLTYMAYYYMLKKNYGLMKKYYLEAIKLGDKYAMLNMADHYWCEGRNPNLVLKYYKMAIEAGAIGEINYLQNYFKYEIVIKYYIIACKLNKQIYGICAYYKSLI